MEEDLQHSNISEEEMGQLHSIHLAMNAIASARAKMLIGPSREICIDCEEDIPLARRQVVQGCLRCINCQRLSESC